MEIDTMATTNTTTANKMTKATAFTIALSLVENSNLPNKAEVAEKISKEIEQLTKKKAGSGKLTAKQTANMGLGACVVNFLRDNPNQMFTIGELMKKVEGLPEDISNQKMTSIFRLDSVKPYFRREMVKGRAYFQYAEPSEEVEE
jgi:hypothetical protein